MLRDSTPSVVTLTASATRTDAETVTLTATSEAGAQVAIEGKAGATRTIQLAMGSNTFTTTATDRLGNQAVATVTVERIQAQPVPGAPVPAHPAISRMLHQGVVPGDEDQTFRPEITVTRAEFAVILARALRLAPVAQPLHLTDADAIPSWAQPQVAALVKAGIIHGRSDGSFDPQARVTRADLAAMIASSLHHLGHTATPGLATFTDTDQLPQWATDAIQAVTTLRLMVGYETGAFAPANPTTRDEVAALLDRMLALP